jgi:hypothetical protein
MILLTLTLLGLAVTDLVRWSPTKVGFGRAWSAVGFGAALVIAVAGLSGLSPAQTAVVAVVAILVLAVWVGFDYLLPAAASGWLLAWVVLTLTVTFGCSGSFGPTTGLLGSWYAGLGFGFVDSVPVDQFLLGLAAGLFLTASANRIVRLLLDAAVREWQAREGALAGGRIIGPLERLIVAAIVLAGDPAAAAIVVTGKGLLRFPEIRSETEGPGPDAITEYFLIGTFTSLVIAAGLAVIVLASA